MGGGGSHSCWCAEVAAGTMSEPPSPAAGISDGESKEIKKKKRRKEKISKNCYFGSSAPNKRSIKNTVLTSRGGKKESLRFEAQCD